MGMIRDNLCENLNRCLKESGISQKRIAEQLQVSQAAVTNWMKGKNSPDIEVLIRLCDILEVSLESLLGLQAETASMEDQAFFRLYAQLDSSGKSFVRTVADHELVRMRQAENIVPLPADNIISLPFYNLPVSAGTGIFLDDTYKEEISAERSPLAENADFALRISGDSMEPHYHNGDILLVQEQQVLNPGECGIFVLNGEGYFKKLGKNALLSFNPKYQPISIGEYDQLKCIGKVIGILS